MLPREIHNLQIPELLDLLVLKTDELMNLMMQKGADSLLRLEKRMDLQSLQSIISKRQTELVSDYTII